MGSKKIPKSQQPQPKPLPTVLENASTNDFAGNGSPQRSYRLEWIQGKRDPKTEADLTHWIERYLGERANGMEFVEWLKDGQVLCRLLNKLRPGSVGHIRSRGSEFLLMENMHQFRQAAQKLGVPEHALFDAVDLYEGRNWHQLALTLDWLAHIIHASDRSISLPSDL